MAIIEYTREARYRKKCKLKFNCDKAQIKEEQ